MPRTREPDSNPKAISLNVAGTVGARDPRRPLLAFIVLCCWQFTGFIVKGPASFSGSAVLHGRGVVQFRGRGLGSRATFNLPIDSRLPRKEEEALLSGVFRAHTKAAEPELSVKRSTAADRGQRRSRTTQGRAQETQPYS
ncbi:hypothetical protein NDU88_008692 [Pleurodeles waltl]|uniref:Uncharacterized protein n=1 Tax=Pleurodeles waltl TaxID=8319 RepID=A0AAV7QPD0_PLEWA|nr:hypothetical protein NDU88_008692 [Pleurodeles waltl]